MRAQVWLIDLEPCAAPLREAWRHLAEALRPAPSAGSVQQRPCSLSAECRHGEEPDQTAARFVAALDAAVAAPSAMQGRGVCHAALRLLLMRRLGADRGLVAFDRATSGRPFLPGSRLDFNISHSGGIGLVGLVYDGRIGVDVELLRPVRLSDDRRARLEAAAISLGGPLPGPGGDRRLLQGWVRLEAAAKLSGRGLADVLGRFSRSTSPIGAADRARPLAGPSSVLDLAFADRPEVAAACAVDRPIAEVQSYLFPTTAGEILDLFTARGDCNPVLPQSAIGCIVS